MALLPLIERFYRDVDFNLGDPHSSVRFPKADKLRALHDVDQEIFDSLLKIVGVESWMGFAEAEITLQDGVSYYRLPEGFRHLIQLESRDSNDVTNNVIRSKSFYDREYGIDILTADRGFRLFPAPVLSADETWYLIYLRSPGLLHYAKAEAVGEKSLTMGTPGADAGEVVSINDYYNGMEVRVYKSDNNAAPQTREILTSKNGTLHLRHVWDPKPEGEVWYELVPTLPFKYDSIYALDVALSILPARDKPIKASGLLRTRRKKWVACKQHYLANVSDRAPKKLYPLKTEDYLATGEIPFY